MLHGRALVNVVKSRNAPTVLRDRGRDDEAGDYQVDAKPAEGASPMEEVAVINCAFVLEEDVLDLARMTVCRIITRDGDDYCRKRFIFPSPLFLVLNPTSLPPGMVECCRNARYIGRGFV